MRGDSGFVGAATFCMGRTRGVAHWEECGCSKIKVSENGKVL
jgi:hypothetical protein